MAEHNLSQPIFLGANWWLWDDLFTGIDKSFYSSKNINIRDNAQSITLNKALVKESSTTVVGKINEIIKTTTWYHIAVWASAWIYTRSWTTWTKQTTSTSWDILSVCEFNWYVYRTTATTLNRITIANVPTWASEVLNWNALVSASYHPMLVSMWDMYIGNCWKVDKVNITNVFETLITLDAAWQVKEINELWGNIRIVVKPWIWNSTVYLWDWTDSPPDQAIPLIWYDIKQSIMFNWYNYLTTGDWLGILDWYRIIPIKEISVFNDNIWSITVHKKRMYIWGTGWVYVFWAKNKNYPDVLNLDLMTSNGSATDDIWCIYSDWTELFVAWGNGSTYGIDKLSTSTFYTTWELVTRGYYNRSLSQIKEALSIMAWFKPMITGQSITLSYSLDWGSYTQIAVMTSTSEKKATFTDDMFITGTFQYIQFKIEMVWPWTSSPELYEIILTFNNNLNR
jgi:hypothetical protein